MRVPRAIEVSLMGRSGFSATTQQTDGYGFNVPYVRQRHCNMCGDACIEMLSQYFGWGLNIDMTTNPRGATEGLDILNVYGTRVRREYAATEAILENKLKIHGPMICSGKYAQMGALGSREHFVLIKGADSANFWVHDPWHGANIQMDKTAFFGLFDTAEGAYRSQ